MGAIVTREQLRAVSVRVNTLRGLIAGLVEQTRALDKRYPDDHTVASLRVEFAGLLCEANKAKIEMDVLCRPAPVVMPDGPVMGQHRDQRSQPQELRTQELQPLRPPVVGYAMLAAHDDSLTKE